MRPFCLRPRHLLILVMAIAATSLPCRAQTRLYLKDGTYVEVRSYEVEGNRVRYYSIADSQWEEMPLSLVDLKATQRAVTEKQEEQQKVLQEAQHAAENSYKLPPNTGYPVARGIRLPHQEGVYAYTGLRLITMIQSQGSFVRDKKRMAFSMALPAPLLKGRSLMVLPGSQAAVRILSSNPAFYVQSTGGAGTKMVLLKLKAGKDHRVVESVEARRQGELSESRTALPVVIKRISSTLFEIRPAQPLNSGEYALGEVGHNQLNLAVWDFGIGSLNIQPRKPRTRSRILPLLSPRIP
ncbi:MAG: hypothetical protein ACRD3O_16445 [Terriglobia bacterium]